MIKTPYNAFESAQAEFDRISEMLKLSEAARSLLRMPLREFHFSIPVKMDDGNTRVFRGFRVQHNDALGPCKGGIRFHPQETADAVRAVAMWMTWKCALVELPLGGSEGGVVCDPHRLTAMEQERLCRGWVRQISRDIGPIVDIPAPDMMTNAQHMLWMLDEYEVIRQGKYPGFITGKPVGAGGSKGRIEATGFGLVYIIREALNEIGLDIEGTTASIQGFGNVGQYAMSLYQKLGGKVLCVSCLDQRDQTSVSLRKAAGIEFEELRSISDKFGSVDTEKACALGYEILTGDHWLLEEVDILIPAAVENQIHQDNVSNISQSVKIIVEGANGPTSPEADRVLRDRNTLLVPDILANAGGVICSYFEQVQCNANYFWEQDEVLGKLDQKITSAFVQVSDLSRSRRLPMRDAAYMIAINRVATVCRERGWIS